MMFLEEEKKLHNAFEFLLEAFTGFGPIQLHSKPKVSIDFLNSYHESLCPNWIKLYDMNVSDLIPLMLGKLPEKIGLNLAEQNDSTDYQLESVIKLKELVNESDDTDFSTIEAEVNARKIPLVLAQRCIVNHFICIIHFGSSIGDLVA